MIDRRGLLGYGAALPILMGAPSIATAASGAFDLWVSDDRFATAPIAAAARIVRLRDGDVTPLWRDVLDDAWRHRGFVVAGATGADALFVLERLAWDRGRRVVLRHALGERGGSASALIGWRIAPVHAAMRV